MIRTKKQTIQNANVVYNRFFVKRFFSNSTKGSIKDLLSGTASKMWLQLRAKNTGKIVQVKKKLSPQPKH